MRCCSPQFIRIACGVLICASSFVARGADQFAIEDITFVANVDRSKQRYLLKLPAEFTANEAHHLLVLLHGHGSDRRQIVDESVKEFQAGREAAAAREMIVVAPDYRAKTS